MTADAYDALMIRHAASRGSVLVRKAPTLVVAARLLGWSAGGRTAGTARVEYPTGRQAWVKHAAVMLPEVDA